MLAVLHDLLFTWMDLVKDSGYWGVILLMAMESSIFPVPSEVVIPPAAILAANPDSGMTITGVILSGTFGSWLGSAITYGVAYSVGRPLVMKFGKYFFMPPHKIERAERFLERYQKMGIFVARLLPVIRHLISIPAGIIRMNFWIFSLITILGSAIWCSVLGWYGHSIGQRNPELLDDPEKLVAAIKSESLWFIIAICVLAVLYVAMLRMTDKKIKSPNK